MVPELVKARGHKIPATYPFIIADEFNTIKKTSEVKKILIKLGFEAELERASILKVRAGKGKARGRKHKTRKGILFVISSESDLSKSAKNIPGTDIVLVENINVELLAPGTNLGRATLFTESAIKKLAETKIFTKEFKGEEKKKAKAPQKKEVEKTTQKKVAAPKAKPAVKKTSKKVEAEE
jgi:large subunit ribosomal protein L4e